MNIVEKAIVIQKMTTKLLIANDMNVDELVRGQIIFLELGNIIEEVHDKAYQLGYEEALKKLEL